MNSKRIVGVCSDASSVQRCTNPLTHHHLPALVGSYYGAFTLTRLLAAPLSKYTSSTKVRCASGSGVLLLFPSRGCLAPSATAATYVAAVAAPTSISRAAPALGAGTGWCWLTLHLCGGAPATLPADPGSLGLDRRDAGIDPDPDRGAVGEVCAAALGFRRAVWAVLRPVVVVDCLEDYQPSTTPYSSPHLVLPLTGPIWPAMLSVVPEDYGTGLKAKQMAAVLCASKVRPAPCTAVSL